MLSATEIIYKNSLKNAQNSHLIIPNIKLINTVPDKK